eukprot:1926867-Pleurochrysis_carterae.AAC.5
MWREIPLGPASRIAAPRAVNGAMLASLCPSGLRFADACCARTCDSCSIIACNSSIVNNKCCPTTISRTGPPCDDRSVHRANGEIACRILESRRLSSSSHATAYDVRRTTALKSSTELGGRSRVKHAYKQHASHRPRYQSPADRSLWAYGSPCKVFESRNISRVLFVGDSLTRQMYLAALVGFMPARFQQCNPVC